LMGNKALLQSLNITSGVTRAGSGAVELALLLHPETSSMAVIRNCFIFLAGIDVSRLA